MLHSQTLIDAFPGYFVLKDRNSVIISANQRLGEVVGFKDIRDYFGLTDYDIRSSAVECADHFVAQDQQVLSSEESVQFVDFSVQDDSIVAMLKTKAPWYNEKGELAGTAASAVTLHKNIQADLIHLLTGDHDKTTLHTTYQLRKSYPAFNLSRRESEVLFFLLRGQTAKQIAQVLCVSPRTIETHIESLKTKMNCSNKAMLIEKAIASNYNGILLIHMLKG